MKQVFYATAMSCLFVSCIGTTARGLDAPQALSYCAHQVDRALVHLRQPDGRYDYTLQPRNITDGQSQWHCRRTAAEEWCSGFWPGILWMDYQVTHDSLIRAQAVRYTAPLLALVHQPVFDHDLGFLMLSSVGKGYAVTGDSTYRRALLAAADSLATLYNPTVGTILSWPRHVKDYGGHNTIMDNMLNLELLFWAANHGGRAVLRDIAVRHAETTMRHQFQPDGTCYHVAVYDTLSGQFLKGVTHQGYADTSMWSRGQSWAIYGYTMVYRFTRDARFLAFAQKVTDRYLSRLRATSNDWVPLWDMDDPRGTRAPKDASAACVVASALLELCQYVDAATATRYRQAAIAMLTDLSTARYQSRDRRVSFLLHATGHHPAGSEIDASIIYADYYYLEALLRLRQG